MTDTAVARYAVAGGLLEALAAQDFDAVGAVMAPGVTLTASVPRGSRECTGVDGVRAMFATWFGDTQHFELVEAVVGDVGSRLYLRWRMRLCAQRLGEGWFVVEQHAYADTDADGRISRLRVLCSGYCPERE